MANTNYCTLYFLATRRIRLIFQYHNIMKQVVFSIILIFSGITVHQLNAQACCAAIKCCKSEAAIGQVGQSSGLTAIALPVNYLQQEPAQKSCTPSCQSSKPSCQSSKPSCQSSKPSCQSSSVGKSTVVKNTSCNPANCTPANCNPDDCNPLKCDWSKCTLASPNGKTKA